MKTPFTLLIAIFISVASFAVPAQSKLSITVIGHETIQIMVGNNRYEGQENSIILNNLQPGSHTVKVYSHRGNQKRSIWGNNTNTELIYSSAVYVKPGYFTSITIDRYGKAMIEERAIRRGRRGNDRDNEGYDDRNDHYNDRYNRDDSRYDQRYDRNSGRYDDSYNNRRSISEHSFASVIQTLKREYSENSRAVLAKQIIDQNNFTTEQVKHILRLFPFEHHKLDLAKYAYRNTTDQRNYFSVYDVFTYSHSKEDLADYIRRYR